MVASSCPAIINRILFSYPAGFVYVFALLYYLTNQGTNILLAQWIYATLYILNLSIVLLIYRHLFKVCRQPLRFCSYYFVVFKQVGKYPPYLLLFLGCTAYRVHSIYVLRLFNDPIAMLLFYISVWLFLDQRWNCGSALYR